MSKPWEQEWKRPMDFPTDVVDADGRLIMEVPEDISYVEATELAAFVVAAPDMARAGLRAVEGVCRFTGLDDVDAIVQRGEPVRLTAEEFGVLVASLRKAGAL